MSYDMTRAQYNTFVNDFIEEEESLRMEKTSDYAGPDLVFQNFLSASNITGMPVNTCAWMFMVKHLARMKHDILNGKTVPREVLQDIRAYCLLIGGLQHKENE